MSSLHPLDLQWPGMQDFKVNKIEYVPAALNWILTDRVKCRSRVSKGTNRLDNGRRVIEVPDWRRGRSDIEKWAAGNMLTFASTTYVIIIIKGQLTSNFN